MHPNQSDVTNILCEFFEIAVHNILYVKKLYPVSIFVPKRKYGVVIHQCIHPDVNSYISNSLKAVNYHLGRNQLRSFCLVFQLGSYILEKFIFDIVNSEIGFHSDPYLLDIEKQLRDFCLKLHASNSYSNSLPEDSTFGIQINTTELSNLEFNDNPMYESFPWIHCNTQDTNLENPDIVPLQSFKSISLHMQIYVETQCSD